MLVIFEKEFGEYHLFYGYALNNLSRTYMRLG
jgi:hypothetical protein